LPKIVTHFHTSQSQTDCVNIIIRGAIALELSGELLFKYSTCLEEIRADLENLVFLHDKHVTWFGMFLQVRILFQPTRIRIGAASNIVIWRRVKRPTYQPTLLNDRET
jgi:hypothetical protein